MFKCDDGIVWYGMVVVEKVVVDGVVGFGGGVLLFNNFLFRSEDLVVCKKYVVFVDKV